MEITPHISPDHERLSAALRELEWVPYRRVNPWMQNDDFDGIGLMNKKGASDPLTESLLIQQSIEVRPQASSGDWQEMEEFNANCRGYLLEFLKSLPFRVSKAKVSRCRPGAIIQPHMDVGCESITRLHWVLQADPGNYFTHYDPQTGRRVSRTEMVEGRGYAIDPNVPHSVQYKGKHKDRIHLVVNCPMAFSEFSQACKSFGSGTVS